MAFNIPIQERDTVDLQQANVPAIQTAPLTQPIRGDVGKQIDVVAEAMNKQAEQLRDKTHKYAKMTIENQRDSIVDTNMASALAAKGENALVQSDIAKKKIKEQTDELLLNAPDEYKAEFNLVVQSGIDRANKTLNGHQYKEINDVHEKTAKERANYATNMFALSTTNPDEAQKNLAIIDQVAEVEARRKLGITTDLKVEPSVEVKQAIDIQKQYARSTAITQAIELMASNEDMNGAEGYLNKYADSLVATDRMKVNAAISKGRGNQKDTLAMRAVNDITSHTNDPAIIMRTLQTLPDGDIAKRAIGIYENRVAFEEKITNKNRDIHKANINEQILKSGGDVNTANQLIKKLDIRDQADARKFAQSVAIGDTVIRDNDVYLKLQEDVRSNPEKFASTFVPNSYLTKLPPKDIEALTQKQKDIIGKNIGQVTSKDFDDITQEVTASEVGSLVHKTTGYMTEDYKLKKAYLQELSDTITGEIKVKMPNSTMQERRDYFRNELLKRTRKVEVTKQGFISKRWDQFWTASAAEQRAIENRPPTSTKIVPNKALTPEASGFADIKDYEGEDPIAVETITKILTQQTGREPTRKEVLIRLEELKRRQAAKNK